MANLQRLAAELALEAEKIAEALKGQGEALLRKRLDEEEADFLETVLAGACRQLRAVLIDLDYGPGAQLRRFAKSLRAVAPLVDAWSSGPFAPIAEVWRAFQAGGHAGDLDFAQFRKLLVEAEREELVGIDRRIDGVKLP